MVDNMKKKKSTDFDKLGNSSKLIMAIPDFGSSLILGAAIGALSLSIPAHFVMNVPYGVPCLSAAAGVGCFIMAVIETVKREKRKRAQLLQRKRV